jgi:hypothetical protein
MFLCAWIHALQAPTAVQMLRYAAHCYVSGIRLSTAPLQAVGMKGRNEEALTASIDLLPRLLHLMTFEDRDGEQSWVLLCLR